MSKAVTNEEVEDVLSSIRRLVSEDKRPLAGLSNAPWHPRFADEPVREGGVTLGNAEAYDFPSRHAKGENSDYMCLLPTTT